MKEDNIGVTDFYQRHGFIEDPNFTSIMFEKRLERGERFLTDVYLILL
ncbi:MAG: hypothetical protein ACXAEU_22470 [Candidatus Hodarchaeales archaeon]